MENRRRLSVSGIGANREHGQGLGAKPPFKLKKNKQNSRPKFALCMPTSEILLQN